MQDKILTITVYSWTVEESTPQCFSSLQLNGVTPGQGFAIEFLLTLQPVLCVLAVPDKRRDIGGFAPLAIGTLCGVGSPCWSKYIEIFISPPFIW